MGEGTPAQGSYEIRVLPGACAARLLERLWSCVSVDVNIKLTALERKCRQISVYSDEISFKFRTMISDACIFLFLVQSNNSAAV